NDGYGRWQVTDSRVKVRAHRFAYEELIGPIPDGLVLDNTCRIRNCVNPEHLDPCTVQENLARSRGWNANALKTHCPQGHPYSPENTYLVKRGDNGKIRRRCRTCLCAQQR